MLLTIVGGWCWLVPLRAQSRPSLEYLVKAEFLANFLTFIEWPSTAVSQPADPFHLCVVGNDPFGSALDQAVRGEQAAGHPITIDRPRDDAIGSCHLLFVSGLEEARLAAVVRGAARRSGVLVVGESRRVLQLCGHVAFVLDGDRVRFDINLSALASHGLKASSKLLRVAREASNHFTACGP